MNDINNRRQNFLLVNIILSFLFLVTIFLVPQLIYRHYWQLRLIDIDWNLNNPLNPDSISFWLMLFMTSVSTGILTSLTIILIAISPIWIRNSWGWFLCVLVLYDLANFFVFFLLSYFNLDKTLGIKIYESPLHSPPTSLIGLVTVSVFILPFWFGLPTLVFIVFCRSIIYNRFTHQIDITQENPSITTDERLQRGQETMEKRLQIAEKEYKEKEEFKRLWWKAYYRFSELSYEEKYRLYEEEMIYSAEDYANKTVGYRH